MEISWKLDGFYGTEDARKEIFLFLSMTTSHLERKRSSSSREDATRLRRTDFVKSFCRRPELVSRSVDYCCLECSMEEYDDAEDEEPLMDVVSTPSSGRTSELIDKIRRTIDFTKRLQKRYAKRMGRLVRPSEILSERRRFWEIVYPWLPWERHLQPNSTVGIMTLNETIVRSDGGILQLLSILQVLKQAEFDRECRLTTKGFYRDLQHLESSSDGDGVFQVLCHLRSLLPPSSVDDTSASSSTTSSCTTPCRESTNATLSRIFRSVSLTKTLDLVLVTRACLLDTIKFLFFLLRLVRSV